MASDFDEILRVQRIMNDNVRRELQEDRQTDLMAHINSIVPNDKKVQIEVVFLQCIQKGYSEGEIRKVLNDYIRDRIFFQPKSGYIQRR